MQTDTAAPVFLVIEGMITNDVPDAGNPNGVREPVVKLLPGFDVPCLLGLVRYGEYVEGRACRLDADVDIFRETLDDAKALSTSAGSRLRSPATTRIRSEKSGRSCR